jgi:CelD/BcsL family acetyltransferase involved in cellulose biosynthesis
MLRRTPSPVLRFEGRTWDELLAARSSNFREQVRRRERKLAREHTLEYRFCDDPSRLDGDLDVLFRLHLARWGDRGAWYSAEAEAFHREFATRALERGWLRLWLLELDERAVAAWYGFRFGPVEIYYQAGRDPAWDRQSVGFVLLAHSIRSAIEDGAEEYWFLEGSEGFKYRFASDDPGLETIAIPCSLRGRAVVAAASRLGRGGLVSRLGRRLAG